VKSRKALLTSQPIQFAVLVVNPEPVESLYLDYFLQLHSFLKSFFESTHLFMYLISYRNTGCHLDSITMAENGALQHALL